MERVRVTQLTDREWLVWDGNQQIASFTETKNFGPDGTWSNNGKAYYGPNAKDKAETFAADHRHFPEPK